MRLATSSPPPCSRPTACIAQEEIFGPVLSVIRWSDYEPCAAPGQRRALRPRRRPPGHHHPAQALRNRRPPGSRLGVDQQLLNLAARTFRPFGGFAESGIGSEYSPRDLNTAPTSRPSPCRTGPARPGLPRPPEAPAVTPSPSKLETDMNNSIYWMAAAPWPAPLKPPTPTSPGCRRLPGRTTGTRLGLLYMQHHTADTLKAGGRKVSDELG